MSVTLDLSDAVTAAKERVRLANGRNGAARRGEDALPVGDPEPENGYHPIT
jgi:hypothetical protein